MAFFFLNEDDAGDGDVYYPEYGVGVHHAALMAEFGHVQGEHDEVFIGFELIFPGLEHFFLHQNFRNQLVAQGLDVGITLHGEFDIRVHGEDPNHVEVAVLFLLALSNEAIAFLDAIDDDTEEVIAPRGCRPPRHDRDDDDDDEPLGGAAVVNLRDEEEVEDDYERHLRRAEAASRMRRIIGSACVKCWTRHAGEQCKRRVQEPQDPREAEKLAKALRAMSSRTGKETVAEFIGNEPDASDKNIANEPVDGKDKGERNGGACARVADQKGKTASEVEREDGPEENRTEVQRRILEKEQEDRKVTSPEVTQAEGRRPIIGHISNPPVKKSSVLSAQDLIQMGFNTMVVMKYLRSKERKARKVV